MSHTLDPECPVCFAPGYYCATHRRRGVPSGAEGRALAAKYIQSLRFAVAPPIAPPPAPPARFPGKLRTITAAQAMVHAALTQHGALTEQAVMTTSGLPRSTARRALASLIAGGYATAHGHGTRHDPFTYKAVPFVTVSDHKMDISASGDLEPL